MSMSRGYLFGVLMISEGMCGISDAWGVEFYFGGLDNSGEFVYTRRLRSQGPDTFIRVFHKV